MMKDTLLIVDDEEPVRRAILRLFQDEAIQVILAGNGKEGLTKIREFLPKVIITDYKMPEMDGLEFIKATKALFPETMVIVLTANGDREVSVRFLKEGAYRYLEKPFDLDELKLTVKQALAQYRLETDNRKLHSIIRIHDDTNIIIGQSAVMTQFFQMLEPIAKTDETVLLQGESGTGKSLFARAIHEKSRRHDAPFVEFNCAAFNESLIESELFGHEKGAFTGAEALHQGRFELAHQGTIFLDEISELSLGMQVKLLRVIQESELERVGGTKTLKVDVRIIAASNQNLERAIAQGTFREDLFFRLNVLPITVPPLRERGDDIVNLANHFLGVMAKKYNKGVTGFTEGSKKLMLEYNWKGNVRELRNVVSRAVILCLQPLVDEELMSQILLKKPLQDVTMPEIVQTAFKQEMTELQLVKLYAKEIYKKYQESKKETARVLDINFRTLNRRLE